MAFDLTMAAEGQTLVMQIGGVMDDECQFPTHESLAGYTAMSIDFEKVIGIDAIGIRRWLSFIGPLGDMTVTFKNVSPAIVLQFNTIRDFLPPNSIIESVLFPIHCGTCGKDAAMLVPVGGSPGPDTAIPKVQIDTAQSPICNEDDQTPCVMQPEYTELKYFSFLRQRQ